MVPRTVTVILLLFSSFYFILLFLFPSYGPPIIGILYDAVAGNDACNGRLAACSPSDPMPNLAECQHFDDVKVVADVGFLEHCTTYTVVDAGKPLTLPVAECMTPHPVTVHPKESIAAAIRRMEEGGYRHLPVVSDSGRRVPLKPGCVGAMTWT